MLALELKIWLILTTIVVVVPLIFLLKKYLFVSFWIIKNFYQKIEHKKNLQKITKEIIYKEKYIDNEKQKYEEIEQKNYQEKDDIKISNKIEEKEKDRKQELHEITQKKIEKLRYQAMSLKEKGELNKYEQKLIEGLSYDKDNQDIIGLLADYYFSIGKHKKALPLLKKILEKNSQDHKSIWQVGQIYLEREDFETAKLLISKAIFLKNDNPRYYVSMAEIMYNLEKINEAIEYMENAVKLRPQNINYLLATASLFEDIGSTENAKKFYFKVLEIEQTNEIAKEKINNI
ncbi:tetratricopeptide repeat protein [Candidatus Vampirococcus lugosii]|uniref:TPR repeat-containing protein n=1 Tax=Candidatus Vampirococcus lugosii TaxID=2789015 RepID=A0ABS5QK14_9BACT|nr:CDC27 family protein [Candidatus Vampirococcus lugosii]MBS8121600.1 TPR repeat-containing protein [Candidatus Vampirococcus lugosii]